MHPFKKKAVVLIIGLLWLFGCLPPISPPVSGFVIDRGLLPGQSPAEGSKKFKTWSLTKDQLDWLYSWFQSHQSDWGMVLATPPVATYLISIDHADDSSTRIEMYSLNESWEGALGISRYSNNGKLLVKEQMNLPPWEVAQLKEMLSEKAQSR
jgi:hypothetical protein